MSGLWLSMSNGRRLFGLLLVLMCALGALMVRLLWLQTADFRAPGDHSLDLVRKSVAQRMTTYVLDDGRGRFVDREGYELSGGERQVLVVFPAARTITDRLKRKRLMNILGIDEFAWLQFAGRLKQGAAAWQRQGTALPAELTPDQANRLRALHIPGIVVANRRVRQSHSDIARSLIGSVGENDRLFRMQYDRSAPRDDFPLVNRRLGVSGLERGLDQKISGVGQTALAYFHDTQQTRIIGPENPFYPLTIVTTIDRQLQLHIEQAMDRLNVADGAVVVMDRDSADVLVMASRTVHTGQASEAESDVNQAVRETTPGSIFKTVVAAAAVAEGVVEEQSTFDCSGHYGKYRFVCWKPGGHGRLTAAQALGSSCNLAFAEIGKRLGPELLENYARQLGLTQKIGQADEQKVADDRTVEWRAIPEEQRGMLFAKQTDRRDEGALIQTAIGQRDVLVTPLQAANMMLTIVNNGQLRAPRVVRELRYRDGTLRERFSSQVLSKPQPRLVGAAPHIRQWLRQTVTGGTATSLQRARIPVAGKTGTAQVFSKGSAREHQWFIGFAPASSGFHTEERHARFAFAIVVRDQPPGAPPLAKRLTLEVANLLANSLDGQAQP